MLIDPVGVPTVVVEGVGVPELTVDPLVMAFSASWNGSKFDGWETSSFLAGGTFLKLGRAFFFGCVKNELSVLATFVITVGSIFTISLLTVEAAFLDGGALGTGFSVAFRFFPGSEEAPPSRKGEQV